MKETSAEGGLPNTDGRAPNARRPWQGWALGAVLLIGSGWLWSIEHNRAEALSQQVETLEREVASLKSEIDDLNRRHRSEIGERDARIADLDEQVRMISDRARDVINAAEDVRSNTDRFGYENWRTVVPDVDWGTSMLDDATRDLERELP